MLTFLAIVHVIIAILLVLFVLLQDSKGGAMGVLSGGGGANTVFGSSGAGNFLTKITKWLAIFFAATCIILTTITSRKSDSVLDAATPEAAVPSTKTIDTTVPGNEDKTPAQPKAEETPGTNE